MNEQKSSLITTENAKEMGRKAGIASGKSRREKKLIKDLLSELLQKRPKDAETNEMLDKYELDNNNGAVVAVRILNNAIAGDAKALRLLLEVMGELDRNKTTVTVNNYEKDCQEAYERGRKEEQDFIMSLLPTSVLRQIANGELEPHERTKEELMEIVGLTPRKSM